MRMRPVRATPLSLALALALAALLLLCVAVPHTASAHSSLGCETVWEAPSKDNDILLCVTDVNRIKSQWRHYVFPALAVLLFVLVLVIFPLFFLCTLCASTCGTPPTEDEGKGSRCCLWMWIIYTLMWGFGVSLLVIVGASSISKSAVHVVFDALDRPIETVNYTKEMIIDFTADWSSGTREPRDEHVDLSAFDEAEKQARLIVDDIRLNYNKYGKHVPMVSYGVGALPIVLMSLLALVAFCRCCVPCLPLVLSWVYWAFGVVFSLLAIVMVVLAYVFSTLCGEIAAHNERDPGLLQWYLVPFCESEFNFTEVNAQVNRTENKMSMDTCRDLLEHCDNIDVEVPFLLPDTGSTQSVQQTLSNVLSGTSRDHLSLQEKLRDALSNAHARPSAVSYDNLISGLTADSSLSRFYRVVGPNFKFLLCGNNITSEDECPDFTHLSDVLYHTRVKAISGACPTPGKSCSVTECAANCTNPRAKEVSQKIVRGSKEARNASIALTYVRPFLECNFVIDVLLKAVETCDDFPAPATMLGVGFFVGGLVFVCALCVAFRGSKSFRK